MKMTPSVCQNPSTSKAQTTTPNWMGHADSKVLLERYAHEFDSVRGGRQIEQDITEMDAAFGG